METLNLKQLSELLQERTRNLSGSSLLLKKSAITALFLFTDITLLFFSMLLSLQIRDAMMPGEIYVFDYTSIIAFIIPLFPLAFYLRGLYPGFGIDVIEELRSITYSITVVFAILAAMSFFVQGAWEYSRLAFMLSLLFSMITIPMGRALVRKTFSSSGWWGIPVIIIGAGQAGEKVIRSLDKHKHIGLRPVVAVDDDVDRWGYIEKIPVIGGLDIIPELAKKLRVDHAIIAMPGVSGRRQQEIIYKYSRYFTHATVIPNIFGLSSLWVSTRDLGGIIGLEVQQKLLKKTSMMQKRIFDFIFALILSLISLPLIILIAIMIKLDSRGHVFFRQERMGKNDSRFKIVKFRTMHEDAENKLNEILEKDPELRQEYEVYHKLKQDPRLTRVGKFLRKFSLDELPQFWNVIKGEMSLIGPRAYMPWEKPKMNGNEEIILKVKPGISGLWQVTDRNSSSFEDRNLTDVYYIRNWSMFLDIYLASRTVAVILKGNNGY